MTTAQTAPRRTIEHGRLLRALLLTVERIGPEHFVVRGGSHQHEVRVTRAGRWSCDCPDSVFRRSGSCKHRLAVYLARQLVGPVRVALRDVLASAR
jgi:hypothetical protein